MYKNRLGTTEIMLSKDKKNWMLWIAVHVYIHAIEMKLVKKQNVNPVSLLQKKKSAYSKLTWRCGQGGMAAAVNLSTIIIDMRDWRKKRDNIGKRRAVEATSK